MTAEEFHDKITHIVDDARSPDQSRIWSDEFYKELQEITRIKCLEAIRNTRHNACEIVENIYDPYTPDYNWSVGIIREIQNISNQDVMPEL